MVRLIALLLSLAASALAAPPSVADLTRGPEMTHGQLSPDGAFVGFLRTTTRGTELMLYETSTRKTHIAKVDLGQQGLIRVSGEASDFFWVGPRRVVIAARNRVISRDGYSGFTAVDVDATRKRSLPGLGIAGRLTRPMDEAYWDSHSVFVSPLHENIVFAHFYPNGYNGRPDAIRINTVTGMMRTIAKNPGPVEDWLFDHFGNIAGIGTINGSVHLFQSAEDSVFRAVANLGGQRSDYRFHRYDATAGTIHASRVIETGRYALQRFDLTTGTWTTLYGNPLFDVAPPVPRGTRDNHRGALFTPSAPARLLGISYSGRAPLQYWFDPALAAAQRDFDAALPKRVNRIISVDAQATRLLGLSTSDRSSGEYYLIDLAAGKLSRLAQRAPWQNETELAPTFAVEIPARDGLKLPSFITRWKSDQPPAPLVLLLRSAPWRSVEWASDPAAQFFATRGFAVLQVNYRGSTGFGRDFAARGMSGLTGEIQQDLLDSVRWAIDNQVADPKQIVVFGRGFGGFLALDLAKRDPRRFSTAIAVDPLVDWRPVTRKNSSAYLTWAAAPEIGLNHDLTLAQAEAMTQAVAPSKLEARLLLLEFEGSAARPPGSIAAYAKQMRAAGTVVRHQAYKPARTDPQVNDQYLQFLLEHTERFLAEAKR